MSEPPIVVDTLDDVKKVIPEDELLEFKVWTPDECYEICTDEKEHYICHNLDGIIACREYYPSYLEEYYPEYRQEAPWELIKGVEGEQPVPYKRLSVCECGSVTADLIIPVRVEKYDDDYEDSKTLTVYLPLRIEYWKSMLSVYVYMTKLKKMYSDSIVRAIKEALAEVWRTTVRKVFYELVDYEFFDVARAISVIEWHHGVKTKYIVVPCRRYAIVVEIPLQAIVDTVRRYLKFIL